MRKVGMGSVEDAGLMGLIWVAGLEEGVNGFKIGLVKMERARSKR